ncbi:MAG: radical SAM protein [Elusimicrobia bacterium]|nr:radical SAM protein [Elusimicrobiota bacterium]
MTEVPSVHGREAPSLSAWRAPLYVGWQLTNACDLACSHCVEESGPGKAFKDELTRAQVRRVLKQLRDGQVPYVSFSGGEPFLHPDLFEMASFLAAGGASVKIETNGNALTRENCSALRRCGVHAVQVSLDGAAAGTYRRMRPAGDFDRVLGGIRRLRRSGVALEVNFVPARFNVGEVAEVVDLAWREGACGFYTGRLIEAGNALKRAGMAPTREQYRAFFGVLKRKAAEYKGRMRVCYHEMGIVEELKYRTAHPAALFIILPNGKVKLINALPFVCGDLRTDSLGEVWERFQRGWRSPKVARLVAGLERDPSALSRLHRWVDV